MHLEKTVPYDIQGCLLCDRILTAVVNVGLGCSLPSLHMKPWIGLPVQKKKIVVCMLQSVLRSVLKNSVWGFKYKA